MRSLERREKVAAVTLLAGLGAAGGIMLLAMGRHKEVYSFALTGAVVAAFIGAAQALETGERPTSKPRLPI